MRFNAYSTWKLLFLHIKTIKMKKIIIMLISILSMYSSSAQKHNDQYIKDASKVAENWLNNIDNKQYENAYQALSINVKSIYQEDIWIKQIIRLKDEIGSLEGRIAKEKYFKSELEGMKNGFMFSSAILQTIKIQQITKRIFY